MNGNNRWEIRQVHLWFNFVLLGYSVVHCHVKDFIQTVTVRPYFVVKDSSSIVRKTVQKWCLVCFPARERSFSPIDFNSKFTSYAQICSMFRCLPMNIQTQTALTSFDEINHLKAYSTAMESCREFGWNVGVWKEIILESNRFFNFLLLTNLT